MAKKKKPAKKAKKSSRAKPKKKSAKRAAGKPAKKAATGKKTPAAAKPDGLKAASKNNRHGQLMPLASTYRPAPNETELGEVDDFYAKIGVIALYIKDKLAVGDTIHVHGHTTDITQKVESMQIDHQSVQTAAKGAGVGVKITDRCRKGDRVFRVD